MKIFVLNLDWETHRREFMRKQLDALGADYEFVKCVIGKDLTEEEIAREVQLESMRASPNWFTHGAIGATMTGYKILESILERNYNCACIMDDDIVLPHNFLKIMAAIEKRIKANEIILLRYLSSPKQNSIKLSKLDVEKMDNKYGLYCPTSTHITGGGANIFSKEAAEGILRVNRPMKVIGDTWHFYWSEGGVKSIRCLYPMCVKSAYFKSTFDYNEMTFKKFPIIPKIMKFIDKYKLFPFYQLAFYKRRREILAREKVVLADEPSFL